MSDTPAPKPPLRFGQTSGPRFGRTALTGLVLAQVLVELLLQGADHHLWGSPLWRGQAYQNGGFWAGLLHDWHPNYAAQPLTMFLTYSVLHAGLGHLVGNMMSLAVLGDLVGAKLGGRGLIRLYAGCALGGAVAFGLLSHSPAPMIGASGAIFGLAGALTVWDAQARRAAGLWNRGPLLALGLAVLNLILWWNAAGNLAWETHFGGFVAGAALVRYAPLWLTRRFLAKAR